MDEAKSSTLPHLVLAAKEHSLQGLVLNTNVLDANSTVVTRLLTPVGVGGIKAHEVAYTPRYRDIGSSKAGWMDNCVFIFRPFHAYLLFEASEVLVARRCLQLSISICCSNFRWDAGLVLLTSVQAGCYGQWGKRTMRHLE